ncbi:hypothetical protein BGZ57DRAFT_895363 [Hyaloscypha finlandica]|nr:hypothetical protein BGZ57DRAFT_895363 [Hyaloscypha finlandica]
MKIQLAITTLITAAITAAQVTLPKTFCRPCIGNCGQCFQPLSDSICVSYCKTICPSKPNAKCFTNAADNGAKANCYCT